jgi:flagella basal body P-ring formation protein FlgA
MCGLLAAARPANAQTVHLWPQAVVVDDEIRLKDIGEVEANAFGQLSELLISASPPPGGSALIGMAEVRRALISAGINLAQVRLKGALECAVSRPGAIPTSSGAVTASTQPLLRDAQVAGSKAPEDSSVPAARRTLRDVVHDWLERQVSRYGIKVELSFGRTSTSVLELSEPEYQFMLRRRSGEQFGMLALEVDILRNGQKAQTVPLLVNVRALRRAVVARRPINQGAEIQPPDIEETAVEVAKIAAVPNVDAGTFVGHRAKRYLPVGTVLSEADVERAPLINRGQVIDVYARVGGVTIVTSAKATQSASLGDTILLHSGGRRDEQFTAVVTGPRRAEVRTAREGAAVARGADR